MTGHSKLVLQKPTDTTVPGQGVHVHNLMSGLVNESMVKYTQDIATIKTLGVEAHGIELYNNDIDDNFYNSYLPQTANQHGPGCYVTP
jgi:hypothetical protein